MKAEDILEGNKLIAEFIGVNMNQPEDNPVYEMPFIHGLQGVKSLKFHSSWDWLMPVVEKIEDISDYSVSIEGVECEVFTFLRSNSIATRHTVAERVGESKIEGVYLTVIDFIKWHNENLK